MQENTKDAANAPSEELESQQSISPSPTAAVGANSLTKPVEPTRADAVPSLATTELELPRSRSRFVELLLTNPNHFGTLQTSPFPIVEKIHANPFYEEIACLGYKPETDELEAVVNLKRANGYLGGACGIGSREFVRFYVERGGVWHDLGTASFASYDLPGTHPVSYGLQVRLTEPRFRCSHEQLLRVRAILSWNADPTPNTPNYIPVWGNVVESTVLIAPYKPAKIKLSDYLMDVVKVDASLLKAADSSVDLQHDLPVAPSIPLKYAELKARYAGTDVPPHRYGYAFAQHAIQQPIVHANPLAATGITGSALLSQIDSVDLSKIFAGLEQGNTTYEGMTCVGYNPATGIMGAVIEIKRGNGYGGGLCSAGSKEYVRFYGFWAGAWHDLGVTDVTVYDLAHTNARHPVMYAALRPVSLPSESCHALTAIPVRAILSWNTPPPANTPSHIPHWGNVRNTHVQPVLGKQGDNHINLITVGGVAIADINQTTGLAYASTPLSAPSAGLDRPFSGYVELCGVFTNAQDFFDHNTGLVNAPHPFLYQVFYRPEAGGGRQQLTDDFTPYVVPSDQTPLLAPGSYTQSAATNPLVTLPMPGGTAPTKNYYTYMEGGGNGVDRHLLASLYVGGLTEGNYIVEVFGYVWNGSNYVQAAGAPVQSKIRVYNRYAYTGFLATPGGTVPITLQSPEVGITSAFECGNVAVGTPLDGTFSVQDHYFGVLSVSMTQITVGGVLQPVNAVTVSGHNNGVSSIVYDPSPSNTNGVSGTWELPTAGLTPCGYTVVLGAWDRAIVNSAPANSGYYSQVAVGFCLNAVKP